MFSYIKGKKHRLRIKASHVLSFVCIFYGVIAPRGPGPHYLIVGTCYDMIYLLTAIGLSPGGSIKASWSHSHTPHSVGLLWASNQLVTETST
jgi:hypothetical protein